MKIIVKLKKGFAKPKKSDVDTPHFVKDHNIWYVHQDSANEEYYRSIEEPRVDDVGLECGFLKGQISASAWPYLVKVY